MKPGLCVHRDEMLSLTSSLDSEIDFLQRLVYVLQGVRAMSAEIMSSLLQSTSSLLQRPLRIRHHGITCVIHAGCHWLHITLLVCCTISADNSLLSGKLHPRIYLLDRMVHEFDSFLPVAGKLRRSLLQISASLLQSLQRLSHPGMVHCSGSHLLSGSYLLPGTLPFGSDHLRMLLPNRCLSIIRRAETENIALYFRTRSLSSLCLEIVSRAGLQILQFHPMRKSAGSPWRFGQLAHVPHIRAIRNSRASLDVGSPGDARVIAIRFFNDRAIRNSYFAVFLHARGCVSRR